MLIKGLGGNDAVAELTGRSVHWGQRPGGDGSYVARAHGAEAHEAERKAFMDGKKRVAIVSEAASVGISVGPICTRTPSLSMYLTHGMQLLHSVNL